MTDRTDPWNPWTVIRTTNPLFYLAYAASSILLGIFAFVVGIFGFFALPWFAHLVTRWERNRVTLLGLPAVEGDDTPPGEPWLWSSDVDMRELGGWGLTVGMGVVSTIAAFVCLLVGVVPVAMLTQAADPVTFVLALFLLLIAIALTLMAAAAVSGMQAHLVQRFLGRDRLRAQVEQLTTSRARIVGGFEVERRRIERDLHDGAQQFLVAASMKVGEAAYLLDQGPQGVRQAAALLSQAQDDSDAALRALRETVAGIHPKVLSDRGLEAAVRDVAARHRSVAVEVPAPLPALPPDTAAAAYYLVAESLTNAAKHAPGAPVFVLLSAGSRLRVTVTDRGPGGLVPRPGGGVEGLVERFAAMGGSVTVTSPPGGPTQVNGELPVEGEGRDA